MPQTLLNPLQRVFAVSLGMNSEVDCDSNDQFNRSIFQSPDPGFYYSSTTALHHDHAIPHHRIARHHRAFRIFKL
jgi:hypothetical protein